MSTWFSCNVLGFRCPYLHCQGDKINAHKKTYHWPSSASGKLRAEWTEKTTRKIEYRIWMTSQASDWNASCLPFKILDCNLNVRMIS